MPQTNGNQQENIHKLRDLIKGIRLGMLTTIAENGELRSRPMYTHDAEFDGDLWFMTGADTAKIDEIEGEQQVNVAYSDAGRNLYISVCGVASIINDRARIREFWNPILKAWFEGPDDPNIRLLKISVTGAEYWDGPSGFIAKMIDIAGAITGRNDMRDENQTLTLK